MPDFCLLSLIGATLLKNIETRPDKIIKQATCFSVLFLALDASTREYTVPLCLEGSHHAHVMHLSWGNKGEP